MYSQPQANTHKKKTNTHKWMDLCLALLTISKWLERLMLGFEKQ